MTNYIHFIWQALNEFTPSQVQAGFMKYTSHQLMRLLATDALEMTADFKVKKRGRDHQIYKREPLGIELFTPDGFYQKLDYIHNNPVRAGLCNYPEEYSYSSAKFHYDGIDHFKMLTHFGGN